MAETLSLRDRIKEYQNEILAGNLQPQRTSEILLDISALLGNINDEITKRVMEYNSILLDLYTEEETANRAKIRADITPEYKAMRDAINTEKVAVELIRSLKYRLRTMDEEMRHGNVF